MIKMEPMAPKELEDLVCKLYRCKDGDVAAMFTAQHFEKYPIDAAFLIVAYVYARELQNIKQRCVDIWTKYNTIFSYPDENDAEHEIKNYIHDLSQIVETICGYQH